MNEWRSSASGRPCVTTTALPVWADPVAVAGRAAEPVLGLWDQLIDATPPSAPTPAPPSPPAPARRWLAHAAALDAPPARVVVLRMTGHIKLGRWLPFRAVQVVAPPHGFVWVARAGWGPLSFTGFDRWGNDEGQMRWLLGGRVPLMTAAGPDITRSAAGRAAVEAVCLPSSFADVQWEPQDQRGRGHRHSLGRGRRDTSSCGSATPDG